MTEIECIMWYHPDWLTWAFLISIVVNMALFVRLYNKSMDVKLLLKQLRRELLFPHPANRDPREIQSIYHLFIRNGWPRKRLRDQPLFPKAD